MPRSRQAVITIDLEERKGKQPRGKTFRLITRPEISLCKHRTRPNLPFSKTARLATVRTNLRKFRLWGIEETNAMHTENISEWVHDHVFDKGNKDGEKSTQAVMWLTATFMVVEIVAGWKYNSMALMADGWHMSSHAIAIGLSSLAYVAARRYAQDARFAFGTWKIEILAGFASAVFLLGVAGMMAFSSVERIFNPQPIQYLQAIVIAAIGLAVNLISTFILGNAHQSHDDPDYHADDEYSHNHHDLNLKAAYIHVMADAATSVLAIVALAGGWILGWSWMDPVMGIIGACMVAVWARSLILNTSKILLNREMDHPVVQEIRDVIEKTDPAEKCCIADLHVWRVGRRAYACAISVVTQDFTLTAAQIRKQLSIHEEIVHSTIEIHRCT